ncbi:MAG TPA: cytochrome c oxidase accessory protein CcoG [Candidatus Sphingobacterium stercorigallinarum]|nr:cytochrome c oxidase accessory protein CcoG [Candidatus Sphingobacterium stercorigallinarum]
MKSTAKQDRQPGQKAGRRWIYAKKPKGPLYFYRQIVGYTLLLFFIAAPFIKIDGNPFLKFNVLEAKFSIFGNLFYPQDFHIFLFGMLIILVCIVLFTAVYGRVWCGWACPQTIFMELVFRRIEYFIEGDWKQQQKLNNGPDSDIRAIKKLVKHLVFLLISFAISNLFLAYIIGVDALYQIVREPIHQHLGGFLAIWVFTLVFYFVFAYVREIVCTRICPYGRLQSVLLDDHSVTVAYNVARGEPRRKRKKDGRQEWSGDCIDCQLCVHVCPTGIDIRDGMQVECVSCTACIDACDAVMEKIQRPKRLIGFYTPSQAEGEISQVTEKRRNTRPYIYTALLFALTAVFGLLIFSRSDVEGRLFRAKGSGYQMRDDGTVINLYSLELMNKTTENMEFELESGTEGIRLELVNPMFNLEGEGSAKMGLFLVADKEAFSTYKTEVKVHIISENKILKTMETTFIAPPLR